MPMEQAENDRSFAVDGWDDSGPSSYPRCSWDDCAPSSCPTWGPTSNGSGDSSSLLSTGEYLHSTESAGSGWGDDYAELEEPCRDFEAECKCAGLRNLGNTCFMNSVLQCLTYTVPLANKIVNGHHRASCQIKGFCAMCAVEDHIKVVFSACGGTVSPSYLASSLDQISKTFVPGQQQDAHEFFFFFIEGLQKCCKLNGVSSTIQSDNDTFISDILMGQMESQVRCNSCSNSSDSVEDFLGLSLEIENCESIDEALSSFMAVEDLQEEAKASCSHCKEVSSRSKQLRFSKSPQVLPIHLKRYKASGDIPTKIERDIKYGLSLDLTPFVCEVNKTENFQECDWKYRLYAVLVHAGWSITSGHYYCYVQTSPGTWHCMNDSLVSRVSEKIVLNQEAYILFYMRESIKEELLYETLAPESSSVSPRSRISEAKVDSHQVSSPVKEDCFDVPPLADNKVDANGIQSLCPQSKPLELLDSDPMEIDIEDSINCGQAKLGDRISSPSLGKASQALKSSVLPGSNGGSPKGCVKPRHPQVDKCQGEKSSLTQGRSESHPNLAGSSVGARSPFENGSQHSFIRLVNKMPSGRRQALMASIFSGQEGRLQSSPSRNMKDTSSTARAVKVQKERSISREKPWTDDYDCCKMQRVGGKRVMASFKDSNVHHEIHGLAKANT